MENTVCKLEWIVESKWSLGCLRRNWKNLENYDIIYNFIIKNDLQAYHLGWHDYVDFRVDYDLLFCYQYGYYALF